METQQGDVDTWSMAWPIWHASRWSHHACIKEHMRLYTASAASGNRSLQLLVFDVSGLARCEIEGPYDGGKRPLPGLPYMPGGVVPCSRRPGCMSGECICGSGGRCPGIGMGGGGPYAGGRGPGTAMFPIKGCPPSPQSE